LLGLGSGASLLPRFLLASGALRRRAIPVESGSIIVWLGLLLRVDLADLEKVLFLVLRRVHFIHELLEGQPAVAVPSSRLSSGLLWDFTISPLRCLRRMRFHTKIRPFRSEPVSTPLPFPEVLEDLMLDLVKLLPELSLTSNASGLLGRLLLEERGLLG